MTSEKDEEIFIEIERLIKLRTLVIYDMQLAERYDKLPEDMTITDLEEWLTEIDTELKMIKNKEPYIFWLFDKCLT